MSKGSKRNKDSDFDGSGGDSDDDFEKDFKSKKNKKTKSDPGSEKKLRDRRSNKQDPFEKEIKKAIELSLKENGVEKPEETISTKIKETKQENESKIQVDDDEDFVKKPKKTEPKDSLNSNASLDVKIVEEDKIESEPVPEIVEEIKEEPVKKPKKTPPKKKSKKFESDDEDEENYDDEDSEEEFKKSKSKKKTPPKAKKTTPGSNKKKSKKQDEPIPLVEKDLNKEEEKEEVVKEPSKVSVSLKFDEPADETKIIVPKLHSSSSSSSSVSRKSLSSIEAVTSKSDKKNLNTSLNLNAAPSPLGRIEIKSNQPQYRVGLSRNSRVKPLHPNVKLA